MKTGQNYWRSLEELSQSPEFQAKLKQEFPSGASELEVRAGVDRRNFLGIVGASLALAGVTTTGCIRKPKEKILAYSKRPEDLVEGIAQSYASALMVGAGVQGILITAYENRPTKIEGNPLHPFSQGATSAWAQASVLELYDPDRAQSARVAGKNTTVKEAEATVRQMAAKWKQNGGTGLAILLSGTPSPTLRTQVTKFLAANPNARLFLQGSGLNFNQRQAFSSLGLAGANVLLGLDTAEVVLSIDSDFLGIEGDSVRNTKLFSTKRRVLSEGSSMSRLYVVEPNFSATGMAADNRLLLSPSEVGVFLLALAAELAGKGIKIPSSVLQRAQAATGKPYAKWVASVANDLTANKGKSIVAVGEKQPAWVHALGVALNDGLGNVGQTVRYVMHTETYTDASGVEDLVSAIGTGSLQSLVILGGNPAYSLPADLGFAESLKKVPESVYLGYHFDETAELTLVHLPKSHDLEHWGDLRASDGTASIVQPVMAPLYESRSEIELIGIFNSSENDTSGYDLVRETWKSRLSGQDFEKAWNRSVHDGIVAGSEKTATFAVSYNADGLASLLGTATASPEASLSSLEIRFPYSQAIFDGRYANNAWLQELPDSVTKLTWDNAALLSAKTAAGLKVEKGDFLQVEYEGRSLKIPAWITPGVADNTVVISQGWGRSFEGRVATGTGFNANLIRTSKAPYQGFGAKVTKAGGKYDLASTQDHGSHENRPFFRETTLTEFKADPKFVDRYEVIDKAKQKTLLWKSPQDYSIGQQWGMTIDLNTCTGCNACTVACNSENNISVVGKERVLKGREMHWIRIDRYFTGSVDDPQAVVQPVACQHCETAPCEQVCPVGATAHSPDGMNDMAYNRCIGTRYCANNCPFKVRRFNYFAFAKENDESNPLYAMQKNPNVTVRFRGVIEKCSYCVQRVNAAKIESKKKTKGIVPDGGVVTACQQVCPADAITFGNINDPQSKVSSEKANPRNYVMLGELAIQPRTSYLAKIRNPNPELV